MLHFVARCSVLETSVNIFSFFFFATRSQSESMSQQGRQTCLRTERQAENCWCRLQIVPFWKMIRNRHHVVFQTYIDALITFKQGKEESSWNCSFEGHWNAQVVFDREKKKKGGVFKHLDHEKSHFFAQFEQLNSISRRTFFKHSTSTDTSSRLKRVTCVRPTWYGSCSTNRSHVTLGSPQRYVIPLLFLS